MPPLLLLVEDDDADAMLAARAIRKASLSARLHRVKDGDEAIAYLQGRDPYRDRAIHPDPAVVLLDIKLPRRDGFEIIRWMREQPAPLSRTAIVMLTSSGRSADISRAYDLGANAYLCKPTQHRELVALMTALGDFWLERCALPAAGACPAEADA
jgi:CheY-like chemotaxis protein